MKIINYIKTQVAKIEATFLGWCPQKLRTPLAVVIFCIPGGCVGLSLIWWFCNLTEHDNPFWFLTKDQND